MPLFWQVPLGATYDDKSAPPRVTTPLSFTVAITTCYYWLHSRFVHNAARQPDATSVAEWSTVLSISPQRRLVHMTRCTRLPCSCWSWLHWHKPHNHVHGATRYIDLVLWKSIISAFHPSAVGKSSRDFKLAWLGLRQGAFIWQATLRSSGMGSRWWLYTCFNLLTFIALTHRPTVMLVLWFSFAGRQDVYAKAVQDGERQKCNSKRNRN